jgi:phosphatidylinositol 4-kinase B
MGTIFKKANKALWFRPYEILITSSSSALIEFMPDTISINALKKKLV